VAGKLEPPLVKILVVVANTSERPWRTDVVKGFLLIVIHKSGLSPKA
jgi:hypothetical protein